MPAPRTIAIVAMAANRVIGRNGGLPWQLPDDLKFFKRTTTGSAILMGRKTWDSIGRPLPKRRNIVLSCSLESVPEGVDLIRHPDDLEKLSLETDVYVIGGAMIYDYFFARCDEVLLTYVFAEYEGDTFLPPFEEEFQLAEVVETHPEFEIRRYIR
tara:strand:- start:4515 stop:4982 length:468 start_codon:yes stop_codon:yes gene_type:complete